MLSSGSGRQATSAGWRVFGNAFGPWGLTVQVARPVALALLEISQAVTNTEFDRHIDEGGKDDRFDQEDQDRKRDVAQSTPIECRACCPRED